jgi:hypothetical protein
LELRGAAAAGARVSGSSQRGGEREHGRAGEDRVDGERDVRARGLSFNAGQHEVALDTGKEDTQVLGFVRKKTNRGFCKSPLGFGYFSGKLETEQNQSYFGILQPFEIQNNLRTF